MSCLKVIEKYCHTLGVFKNDYLRPHSHILNTKTPKSLLELNVFSNTLLLKKYIYLYKTNGISMFFINEV